MKYTIEKANQSDFPQLIALFKELAIFEKNEDKMVNSVDRMKQEQDFFHAFVVKNTNNEIVGYASYFFAYYTWTGKALYMDDLYVKKEYRGNGMGLALINNVIEYAKISNCSRLRWQVSGWNESAIRFYEKLGAEINNTEQNCDITL